MTAASRTVALLIFALAPALAGDSALCAQALHGLLVRRGTAEPVAGARLVLQALTGRTLGETTSDSLGRFVLRPSGGGHYRLVARHAEYKARNIPVTVRDGLELTFQLELELLPPPEPAIAPPPDSIAVYRLDPMEVTANRVRPAERRRATSAHVITRVQIEQRRGGVRHVGDLVRTMPGLNVTEGSQGGIAIGLCIESERRYMRGVPSVHISPRDNCEMVKVIIDDYPVFDPGSYLTHLHVNDIESVEFVPPIEGVARYGADAARGVLLIYTRGSGPHARIRE